MTPEQPARSVEHTSRVPSDRVALLSARERAVLALLAEGDSNERIAEQLEVNARTVESHTSRIFEKLGLRHDRVSHRRVIAALAYLQATAAPGGR